MSFVGPILILLILLLLYLTGFSGSEFSSPQLRPSLSPTGDSLSLTETFSICSADSVFASAIDTVTSVEGESATSSSSGSAPIDSNNETAVSSMKDEPSPSDQEVTDAGSSPTEGMASEIETLEGTRKNVDNMSLIEDLSHIYENFLAFASAVAESNPEELYHVYENVTQALHPGSQLAAQSDGGVGDNLTSNESNEINEVESPAMEMSSEFEKITLQENEDGVLLNRSSGICDDTTPDKHMEDVNQKEQDAAKTVENDKTLKVYGEILVASVNSGGVDEDLVKSSQPVIGESQDLIVTSRKEESAEFGGHVRDMNWIKTEDFGEASDNELPSESLGSVVTSNSTLQPEDKELPSESLGSVVASHSTLQPQENELPAESLGNVVTSRLTVQAEAVDEKLIQERSAVDMQPSLVHADRLSDTKTGDSSFYVVEEGNDQFWREMEDKEVSEPVIATSEEGSTVQVSLESNEDQSEKGSFVLDVEKSAFSERDEDRTTDVTPHDPQSIHNDYSNSNICTEAEVSVENDLGLAQGKTQGSHEETGLGEDEKKMFLEREAQVVPESTGSDSESGELSGSTYTTSTVAKHSNILHDTTQEEIALNSSSQLNVRVPGQESEVIHTFGAADTGEDHAKESLEVSCEDAEKLQSLNTELSSDDLPASEHAGDNSWLQQDGEQSQETVDEGIELERYSSDEGFYTPEDTVDLSVRSDSVAGVDRETNPPNDDTQNSDPEPSCVESETRLAPKTEEVLQSEGDTKSSTAQGVDELQHEVGHDSLSEAKDFQNDGVNNSSWEDKQQLTNSQMDILKAVTAAFEEILELHGEESDADDTRL